MVVNQFLKNLKTKRKQQINSLEEPYTRDLCLDCGVSTFAINEYYMVIHPVWEETGLGRNDGMLCIGCLETRLGRTLKQNDFLDCLLNVTRFDHKSARLIDRLKASTE